MSKLFSRLIQWIIQIRSSIAFYPTLIAAFMASLGLMAILLEGELVTQKIVDQLPVLIIDDEDTARSILNTLIGGIITLMVFSFSMVMVLLNQASSNYSPRLLPGLITNKRHQIVLGFYLGTILFCILCSINILPKEDVYAIPSLSILISIVLGVGCLGLFIYFIHSISESIQINNIIYNLYCDGLQELETYQNLSPTGMPGSMQTTHSITANKSGYLVNISITPLISLANDHQVGFEIIKPLGLFVFDGEEVIRSTAPLDEETREKVLNCLQLNENEQLFTSHFTAAKNITEVALKAMSPGINDPGTALLAINYLFLLLAKRMQIPDQIFFGDEQRQTRLIQRLFLFEKLIYNHFAELRTYAAHDQLIVAKMLEGIDYLLRQKAASDDYHQVLFRERKVFIDHATSLLPMAYDHQQLFGK